jgi:uncharacterized membrane protein
MSTLDTGLTLIRSAAGRVSASNRWMGNAFKSWMPTGLYARALLIMIVPMVVRQSVVAFVFMERHWNTVTRRLSAAVVQDIASLIDVYKFYPQDKERAQLRRVGQRLQLLGGEHSRGAAGVTLLQEVLAHHQHAGHRQIPGGRDQQQRDRAVEHSGNLLGLGVHVRGEWHRDHQRRSCSSQGSKEPRSAEHLLDRR